MFKTIHLNKGYWDKKIPGLKIGKDDPLQVFSDDDNAFSEAMKSFKFHQVYKYTHAGRLLNTQAFIKEWIIKNNKQPVILDIGASDGVTSMELIQLLGNLFKEYYVTDYNIRCTYVTKGKRTYFFDQSNNCFLVASNKFVYYPSNKWLFNLLFKNKINNIKEEEKNELLLIRKKIQKELIKDDRIKVKYYNIFEKWENGKADIVVVANLLNRIYFTDEQIQKALQNCYDTLHDDAIFAIIRNEAKGDGSEIEKANVYQKDASSKSFKKIFEINNGVEISDFIVSLNFQ